MYICKECGEVFEEPVVIYDDPSPSGVSLSAGAYEYQTCPYCDSDDIDEATECPSCGEWHDNAILCDECMDAIRMKLEKIRLDHKLSEDDFGEVITEVYGW